MVKLQNYITKHNIKLIDFFKKFDVDGNMSLGNNEFRQALEDLGIKLSEDELETLIGELDKDGDGEINTELVSTCYSVLSLVLAESELVTGNQEATAEILKRKQASVIQAFSDQSNSVLRTSPLTKNLTM
ncbi:LRRC74B [Bugula neritina]|uniref:LRRC74B n=1 Tax=Bugula neritina TaxID=10212 RepID=A0A7J7JGY9_BUGNE|nr:LRRC74B [Bugula neritina]